MNVSVDFDGIPPGPDPKAMVQALERQVLLAVQYVKAVWIGLAQISNISDSGAYVRGIDEEGEIVRTFHSSGDDSYEVHYSIINTSKHADIIENGHKAFHLPSAIDWWDPSKRVKRTKDGRPYLSIPLRHYAPSEAGGGATHSAIKHQMPAGIYAEVSKQSRRIGLGGGPIYAAGGFTTPKGNSVAGQMFVAADRYRWSGTGAHRLTHNVAAGVTVGPDGVAVQARRGATTVAGRIGGKQVQNPAWQTSKYHGMMKTGPAGHTRYLTIRTITPDSPGWNIPARPGHGIARKVQMALEHGPGAARLRQLLIAGIMP